MAYGIVTTMSYKYSNGAVAEQGQRRLIVPSSNTDVYPGYTEEGSWSVVTNWLGSGGFTAFGPGFISPTGSSFDQAAPWSDGLIVNSANLSWSNIEFLYNQGIRSIYFDFNDSTGRHRMEYALSAPLYPDQNNVYASGEWKFYLNNDLILDGIFNGGRTGYSFISQNRMRQFRSFGGVPWLIHNGENEAIYSIIYNCDYEKVSDVPVPLPGDYTIEHKCLGSYAGSSDPAIVANFKRWLNGYEPEEYTPTNPFEPGGTTNPYGPDSPDWKPGNFSDESDNPETDNMPVIDAVGTGFSTLFTPSKSQLVNLAALMWNQDFLATIRNLVENVSDLFVSLAMVPFSVPQGNTVTVTWFGISTGVTLTLAANQFLEFDMGTINLGDDYRAYSSSSALDYSPFSQLGIYMPFIGYRELDIDECRNASINLRYRIDILSGECVAIIKIGDKDIYQFTGNVLAQIPISNENIQSIISDAVQIGIAAVSMSSAAGVAAAEEAVAAGMEGEAAADLKSAHAASHMAHGRTQLASATANAAMGLKPHISKTGSVSGSAAMMAVKQPYLMLKTPRQAIPSDYERYCGFPSNITDVLGNFSGYTVVEDIRLNNLTATSAEVSEIYKLLKQGVII